MNVSKKLYMICSNDYLQTAFFCGTGKECCDVLGMKNMAVFYSAISHGVAIHGFFHIEKAPIDDGSTLV